MAPRDHGSIMQSGVFEIMVNAILKARTVLFVAARSSLYLPLALCSRGRANFRSTTLPRLAGNPALIRRLAAARIVFFPRQLYALWRLQFFRPYLGNKSDSDTFFFLTHNFYLSKYFTVRQRVDCAIRHFQHEQRSCGGAYHLSVYHSPSGMILWNRVINCTSYSLILQATEDFRFEGNLSILCLVDGVRICRLSFTYVRGALFGLDFETTMFVTRNQIDRSDELQRFRQDFKQNSPPYFCLAALSGIAMAHGIRMICMIKDDAQVAYDERYANSFKNSYSAFWEALGAEEMAGRHAYKMTVPFNITPIANVKHRNRAIARRQNWLEITINAREAMLNDRLTGFPSPIDVEATTLLPVTIPAEARRDGREAQGMG